MLYIICGIILLLILARFGKEGIGCFFLIVLAAILWRLGVLSFITGFLGRIFRWIFVRIIYYYDKLFGGDESLASISTFVLKQILS
ncbi:hypothetical protein CM49_05840 [Paenibacillus sp. P1XP2]|nr:hypothetical protein CM49_05840 [Paenibacillus sp. P1XP2]